jgi:hypothetical protein
MDMLLELLLLVHDLALVMLLLVLLVLFPLEIFSVCSNITLALFFELISYDMFLTETQRLHFRTKFCILPTLMIN